jgi:hypothetical protein
MLLTLAFGVCFRVTRGMLSSVLFMNCMIIKQTGQDAVSPEYFHEYPGSMRIIGNNVSDFC